ncbi:hypothetical protein ACWCP6_24640 [Streptomyces sp. NPDC002004]
MQRHALSVYLNDHLGGSTSGVELSQRIAREHRSSVRAPELRQLAVAIAQDRESLLDLMAALDVSPRRYKVYGGWAAEKAARLKPNGRLLRRSRLSTLVELETLRIGIQGKRELWQALLAAAPELEGVDERELQRLLDRAESQMETVDELHRAAAAQALAPSPA